MDRHKSSRDKIKNKADAGDGFSVDDIPADDARNDGTGEHHTDHQEFVEYFGTTEILKAPSL